MTYVQFTPCYYTNCCNKKMMLTIATSTVQAPHLHLHHPAAGWCVCVWFTVSVCQHRECTNLLFSPIAELPSASSSSCPAPRPVPPYLHRLPSPFSSSSSSSLTPLLPTPAAHRWQQHREIQSELCIETLIDK